MENNNFYKFIIKNSPLGYAYHKVIYSATGKPIDYEFIEVNTSFEKLTGLKSSDIIGKRITKVIPEIKNDKFDWIAFYGDVALNGYGKEFKQYSHSLKRWYKVNVYSTEKDFFVTQFSDISDEVKYQEEYNGIIASLNHIVFELNDDYTFLNVFVADDDYLFMPRESFLNKNVSEVFDNQFALYFINAINKALTSNKKVNIEYKSSIPGDETWFNAKILCKKNNINENRIFVVISDITNQKKSEEALFNEKERLKVTLHSIADGVIATDNEGKIVMLNKVAEELTGWKEHDAIGKSLIEIFNISSEYTNNQYEDPVCKVLETGKKVELSNHTVLISKDGVARAIADSAAPIKDQKGNILGVVLVFRDVTEENKQKEKITYLSYHDELTGLYNRRFFEDVLKRLDTENQLPISLIMGDVNGLKIINDVFGHGEGDLLLKTISCILQKSCRAKDIIARWGGDEFVILLPKTSEKIASEICDSITKTCINITQKNAPLSISLGYGIKENINEDIIKVLKKAEDFMYKRKLLESKSLRSSVISSLKNTLYEKSNETKEHAERLNYHCEKIGIIMGLSKSDLYELELLSMLHDIGKVAIKDSILTKPDKLTDEEWIEMKKHSQIGYRIAQSAPELAQIAEYILAHHERWDGNGYPQGLRGENIPLLSRILSVVDAYDAMTEDRQYRRALSSNKAKKELLNNAGSQFDPNVVRIFLEDVLEKENKQEQIS